jgi:TPR repeat protein
MKSNVVLLVGCIILTSCAQPDLQAVSYDQLLSPKPTEMPKLEADARTGNITALLRLARYYDVVKMDSRRARFYFSEAARHGSTVAARTLADIYVSKESFNAAKAIAARKLMRRNLTKDPLTVDADAKWAKEAYAEAISNGIDRATAAPLLQFAAASR